MQEENCNTEEKEINECKRFIHVSIMNLDIAVSSLKVVERRKQVPPYDQTIEEKQIQALYVLESFCDFIDDNINQIMMYM